MAKKISKAKEKKKTVKKTCKAKKTEKSVGAKVKKTNKVSVFLSDVSEDKRFFCVDGEVFGSLKELEKALKSMSKDVFSYHVNSEKNDFSSWISDVIGDRVLANDLRKSSDQRAIAKKIKSRISYLKQKIKS